MCGLIPAADVMACCRSHASCAACVPAPTPPKIGTAPVWGIMAGSAAVVTVIGRLTCGALAAGAAGGALVVGAAAAVLSGGSLASMVAIALAMNSASRAVGSLAAAAIPGPLGVPPPVLVEAVGAVEAGATVVAASETTGIPPPAPSMVSVLKKVPSFADFFTESLSAGARGSLVQSLPKSPPCPLVNLPQTVQVGSTAVVVLMV